MDIIVGIVVGLIFGIVLIAIITFLFLWLWNTTVPEVFGLKTLTFFQAFKIMLISSMLFGGGTSVFESGHEIVPDNTVETAGNP